MCEKVWKLSRWGDVLLGETSDPAPCNAAVESTCAGPAQATGGWGEAPGGGVANFCAVGRALERCWAHHPFPVFSKLGIKQLGRGTWGGVAAFPAVAAGKHF